MATPDIVEVVLGAATNTVEILVPGIQGPRGESAISYGPYASLAAARAAIALATRFDGLTVQITGLGNYWWLASDLSDNGLIFKGLQKTGTPLNDQIGVWTDDHTLEGSSLLSFDATTGLTLKRDLVLGELGYPGHIHLDDGASGNVEIDISPNTVDLNCDILRLNGVRVVGLGETSATAYRGDRGKAAYDHSLLTGNPHGIVWSDIAGSIPVGQLPLTVARRDQANSFVGNQDITGSLTATSGARITGGGVADVNGVIIGSRDSGTGAIWSTLVTPSGSNYMIAGSINSTIINGSSSVIIRTNNVDRLTITNSLATITFPLGVPTGTAALPALVPSSDTNTGIWFPAADTIAFSTGGVEDLRIHNSGGVSLGSTTDPGVGNLLVNGSIGLGTTPLYKLHVRTGTNQNAQFRPNTAYSGAGDGLLIQVSNDADSASVPLMFGASKYQFMVGSVGIANLNPIEKLDVTGNIRASGTLQVLQTADTSNIKSGLKLESNYSNGSTAPALQWQGTGFATIANVYPTRTAVSYATDLNFDVINAAGTLQNVLKLSSEQVATFAGRTTWGGIAATFGAIRPGTVNGTSIASLDVVTATAGGWARINADQIGFADRSCFTGAVAGTIKARNATDTADANFTASNITASGGVTVTGRIENTAFNTLTSNLRMGSIEVQSYALNNGWIGENVYYDGQWKYRATGYTSQLNFATGEMQFRLTTSGTGGTVLPSQLTQLKVNVDGNFAVGPAMSNSSGIYTGATFRVDPSGNATAIGNMGSNTNTANSYSDGVLTITAGQINRGGGGNVELQYASGGPVRMFGLGSTPISFGTTGSITAAGSVTATGASRFNATTASITPLTVRGFASQTANLQEWQDSTGTILARVTATGNYSGTYYTSINGLGTLMIMANNQVRFDAQATNASTVIIRGVASQTANLTDWQNSAGTGLAAVWANGDYYTAAGMYSTGQVRTANNSIFGFSSTSSPVGSVDANLSRNAAGILQVGTTTTNALGSLLLTNLTASGLITTTSTVHTGFGTQSLPAYAFNSDVDSGLYQIIDNYVAIGTGGICRVAFGPHATGVAMNVLSGISFSPNAQLTTGDVQISRTGTAGQLQVGTTANNALGSLLLTNLTASGTVSATSHIGNLTSTTNGNLSIEANGTGKTYICTTGSTAGLDIGHAACAVNVFGPAQFANNVTLAVTGSTFLKLNSYTSGNSQMTFAFDGSDTAVLGLMRIGTQMVLKANNGLKVRNFADTSDAALTCSNLTASGFVRASGAAVDTALGFSRTDIGVISGTPRIVLEHSAGSIWQMDNNIGDLRWFISGTVRMRLNPTFRLGLGTNVDPLGQLHVVNNATTIPTAIFQAAPSQTANLTEWRDSATNVLASVDSAGRYRGTFFTDLSNAGTFLVLTSSTGRVEGRSALNPVFVVRGAGSQIAALQEWQNSAGTALATMNSAGTLITANLNSTGYMIANSYAASGQGSANATETGGGASYSYLKSYATTGGAKAPLSLEGSTVTFRMGAGGITGPSISATGNVTIPATTASSANGLGALVVAGGVCIQGQLNINTGAGANNLVDITGPAGFIKAVRFLDSGGNRRWDIRSDDAAESGSDAGSNFQLRAFSDANVAIDTPLSIPRAAGAAIVLSRPTTITSSAPATQTLIVRSAALQTANMHEWQNVSSTVLSYVAADGVIKGYGLQAGSLSFSGVSYNGISNPAGFTTLPSLVVQGIASQIGDLQQWRNSAGTVLAALKINGDLALSASPAVSWNSDASLSRNTAGLLQIGTTGNNAFGSLACANVIASSIVTSAGLSVTNSGYFTRITRDTGVAGRLNIGRPHDITSPYPVSFGDLGNEINIRGSLGVIAHSGTNLQVFAVTSDLSLGCAISGNVTIACPGTVSVSGTAFTAPTQSLSTDPTTTDISAGTHRMVKNSSSGTLKLWANDGGVMRSVTLS